mgnify:CR=1 FL=1
MGSGSWVAVMGSEREASPRVTTLKRRGEKGSVRMQIDLVAVAEGTVPDMYLQADDIVKVEQDPGKKMLLGMFGFIKEVFSLSFVLN